MPGRRVRGGGVDQLRTQLAGQEGAVARHRDVDAVGQARRGGSRAGTHWRIVEVGTQRVVTGPSPARAIPRSADRVSMSTEAMRHTTHQPASQTSGPDEGSRYTKPVTSEISMNSLPEPSLPIEPEPLDFPRIITKAALLAMLDAAGMQRVWQLDAALSVSPAMRDIRDRLTELLGDRPGLCELEGRRLAPLVPPGLQTWPVWYVRLPAAWADDVERLVSQASFEPHLLRDDHDPWRVAQFMAIVSQPAASGWPAEARRFEVDDRAVSWTLDRGASVGGVLVIFECAGHVAVTAYPVDELLLCQLQAGDGASSRNPLFDLTLAEVQAMTRALEEGRAAGRSEDVLRMPVVHLGDASEDLAREDILPRVNAALHRLRPRISCTLHGDGALGPLDAIVDWWPEGWERGRGPWLRLDVPPALHDCYSQDGLKVSVVEVPAEDDAPAMVLVTLVRGPRLYLAELRLDEDGVRDAVRQVCAGSRCRLALVNIRNGRPLVLDLDWPPMEVPAAASALPARPEQEILEVEEHPAARRLAQALSDDLGVDVRLHRCRVRAVGTGLTRSQDDVRGDIN